MSKYQASDEANLADYEIQRVDTEYSLVTSTSKGDNLPLTSFRVEERPCLDHRDTSKTNVTSPSDMLYYPLELDRLGEGCQELSQFGERFDTRYLGMGAMTNEFDVQEENKVLDTLQSLPNYSLYISEDTKKDIKYGFWSRPTISWSLSCEKIYPRSALVAEVDQEMQKEDLEEMKVIWIGSVAYGVGSLATFVVFVLFLTGCFGKEQAYNSCMVCSSGLLYFF